MTRDFRPYLGGGPALPLRFVRPHQPYLVVRLLNGWGRGGATHACLHAVCYDPTDPTSLLEELENKGKGRDPLLVRRRDPLPYFFSRGDFRNSEGPWVRWGRGTNDLRFSSLAAGVQPAHAVWSRNNAGASEGKLLGTHGPALPRPTSQKVFCTSKERKGSQIAAPAKIQTAASVAAKTTAPG
jgi:hypothetical protein